MRVVGGDDHQRVAVGAGEGQRFLYRFVQIDGFTNLPARVGGVILLIDRRALYLQEETVRLSFSSEIAFSVIAASVGVAAVRAGLFSQVTAGLSRLP